MSVSGGSGLFHDLVAGCSTACHGIGGMAYHVGLSSCGYPTVLGVLKDPLLCHTVGQTGVSALPRNGISVGRTLLSGLPQHAPSGGGPGLWPFAQLLQCRSGHPILRCRFWEHNIHDENDLTRYAKKRSLQSP